MEGREKKLRALAAEIEQDMELVGATAIEDKLQDGAFQLSFLLYVCVVTRCAMVLL